MLRILVLFAGLCTGYSIVDANRYDLGSNDRKEHWSNPLRRLIGSNCIVIERGAASRYYDCVGCRIEEATACVDDMRQNRSLNVYPTCDLSTFIQSPNPDDCCPKLDSKGRIKYLGSAYPETIRCLKWVGCEGHVIYNDLVRECQGVCDPATYVDGTGAGLCFATFSGARRLAGDGGASLWLSGVAAVVTIFLSITLHG